MIAKLEALLMALTLFFVGLFYGDEPVKVEFNYGTFVDLTVLKSYGRSLVYFNLNG